MTKEQFLARLEQLLADLSREDREDALQFYREYLEDAGPENEAAALEELGLTTADFAGLVKSPREDGGYDYFLRYNEFIPINTWEIQKLKTRVAELEARLGSQTEA